MQAPGHPSRTACCALLGAALLSAGAALVPIARGADKAEKPNAFAAQRGAVAALMRKQSLTADEQKLFNDYFTQYLFKQFESPTPTPTSIPFARKELLIFLKQGKSGPVYNQLLKMTVERMKRLAGPTAHPAARVNAVLVLGELSDQEPDGKPLKEVFPLLLFVVGSPKFPDAAKVAGLTGLERFAKEDAVPADKKAALTGQMLAILNQADPPAGRSDDGHEWIRRCAAQVLAALGSPGPKGEVLAAYEAVIRDPASPATLRNEVAECLGRLKYPPGAKLDYASVANLLGHQTVEICQREIGKADSDELNPARRMIVYTLFSVLHGLEGTDSRSGLLAAAAGSPNQKEIEALRSKIKTTYTTAEDADLSGTDFHKAIEDMIAELQSALPPKPELKADTVAEKPAAPAATAPAAAAAPGTAPAAAAPVAAAPATPDAARADARRAATGGGN